VGPRARSVPRGCPPDPPPSTLLPWGVSGLHCGVPGWSLFGVGCIWGGLGEQVTPPQRWGAVCFWGGCVEAPCLARASPHRRQVPLRAIPVSPSVGPIGDLGLRRLGPRLSGASPVLPSVTPRQGGTPRRSPAWLCLPFRFTPVLDSSSPRPRTPSPAQGPPSQDGVYVGAGFGLVLLKI